jgi:predicted SprT family Zn-dependent metalloprotease
MTLEELKAEAKKHGYTLTKKIVYEPLKKCPCGSHRSIRQEISLKPKGKYYRCAECGRKGELASSWYQARANWNKTLDKHDC